MQSLSDEQSLVYDYIKSGKNVIVDAVAGSGKSTTVLGIAKLMPNKKFLQVTYNSMLRYEIKTKVESLGLKNLEVHTYHSLAVKYFHSSAYTDSGIRYILKEKLSPRIHIPKKDIIVIDETQDMTFLYFQFMDKFLDAMCKQTQEDDMEEEGGESKKDEKSLTKIIKNKILLIILGDYMQGLYQFKGADIRFLTLAQEIWSNRDYLKSNDFVKTTLKMSYRITDQMAKFINETLLAEQRLHSCREGPLAVQYIRYPRYQLERTVLYHIEHLISLGACPGDFFILSPSVKGTNSHVRKMENHLVRRGYRCHIPMLDTELADEKVIQKKIVFCTFHSCKGRQRKYVFIMGFDQSYMRFYGRDYNNEICPSTLYVACTRATHGLFLLEKSDNERDQPLEFLKQNHFHMKKQPHISFQGLPYHKAFEYVGADTVGTDKETIHNVTPTELIRFIPEPVLDEITPVIDQLFILSNERKTELDIPVTIQTDEGIIEEVSDLNGIAIPCMYFHGSKNSPPILYDIIHNILSDMRQDEHIFLREHAHNLPAIYNTPADFLYLANVFTGCQERLYFKLKQIQSYNWLSDDTYKKCQRRMEKHISNVENAKIEQTIIHYNQELKHFLLDDLLRDITADKNEKYRFSARVDLITDNTVWEIKCVKEVTMDHKLQLIIYAWLWKAMELESMDFRLFNIRNEEIFTLNASLEQLTWIVKKLIQGKYHRETPLDDTTFIEKSRENIY